MASIPKEKLARLTARWETLQNQLASGSDQETFIKLSKEFAELDPLVASIKALQSTEQERDSARSMPRFRTSWASRKPFFMLVPLWPVSITTRAGQGRLFRWRAKSSQNTALDGSS